MQDETESGAYEAPEHTAASKESADGLVDAGAAPVSEAPEDQQPRTFHEPDETPPEVTGTGDAAVKATEVNVVPSVKGAVVPERGKPIPFTEARAPRFEATNTKAEPVEGNPQYQKPDPYVTAGNAWDTVREVASAKTLPVGATEQPGAPVHPAADGSFELTREAGRARRQPPAKATDGGTLGVDRKDIEPPGVIFNAEKKNVRPGDRTLEPRGYLAAEPDPRVTPAASSAGTRTVFPQHPVAHPSQAHEDLHESLAAKHAEDIENGAQLQ